MENIWEKSRNLIALGKGAEALKLLRVNTIGGIQKDVILYQARLSNLEKQAKIFQVNTLSDQLKLYDAVLDFILKQEKGEIRNQQEKNSIYKIRIDRLHANIENTYNLIEEWEEKMKLSEHQPSEQRRSQNEINRLQAIIENYIQEIKKLERR